jgi:hypothetical protein
VIIDNNNNAIQAQSEANHNPTQYIYFSIIKLKYTRLEIFFFFFLALSNMS